MNPSTREVWEQFSDPLRNFIRRRVSNDDDSEDILQDVFVKVHTHLNTLQDDERLAPWLYRITRNAITDYYRSVEPSAPLPETIAVEPEPLEAEPEAQIASGLKGMIAGLPDIYRQALILTEIEGLKQSELAHRLGLSLSGAKSRVQRGRAMLRDALLDCCHFEFDLRGQMVGYTPRPDCCRRCRC